MTTNRKSRILIVDDLPSSLKALEEALQATGASIIKANNSIEALAFCKRQDFSLAVLNVRTLETEGYQLAEKLGRGANGAWLPIIFISNYSEDMKPELMNSRNGSVDFLCRPFETVILADRAKKMMEASESRMKNDLKDNLTR